MTANTQQEIFLSFEEQQDLIDHLLQKRFVTEGVQSNILNQSDSDADSSKLNNSSNDLVKQWEHWLRSIFSVHKSFRECIHHLQVLELSKSSRSIFLSLRTLRKYVLFYLIVEKHYPLTVVLQLFGLSFSEVLTELYSTLCTYNRNFSNEFKKYFSLRNVISDQVDFSWSNLPNNIRSQFQWNTFYLNNSIQELDILVKAAGNRSTPHDHQLQLLSSYWEKLLKALKDISWWKRKVLEIIFLTILLITSFYLLKKINGIYEKILFEKTTLVAPEMIFENSGLTFKDQNNVPRKEIKMSSTQIDDLENIETLEKKNNTITEFFPESDILDTSVNVAGWNDSDYGAGDADGGGSDNEFRDKYFGQAKAYRLMMNTSDLFDMRLKLISICKKFKVSEAGVPLVGKQTLEGIYYNLHVPSNKINNFLAEVGGLETTNVYISKTSKMPLKGHERVFIWVKRI